MSAASIIAASGFEARPKVVSLKDVSAAEFISAYAAFLEKSDKFLPVKEGAVKSKGKDGKVEKLPVWTQYIKTGISREMPPTDAKWYYVRAASVARKIYLNGGIGLGALAHWYGKAATTGNKPQHHVKAARGLLRHILNEVSVCSWAHQAVWCVCFPSAAANCLCESCCLFTSLPSLHPPFPPLQLENAGLIEQREGSKGRFITSEGQRTMDNIAKTVTF